MSAQTTPSHACCTTPPIVSKGYNEKGSYSTVDGIKTYVTGSSSAAHGILIVYDVFGFSPQGLQGADILAHGDSSRPNQVFIPDFLEGDYASHDWFQPPQTAEKGQALGEYFKKPEAGAKTVGRIPKIVGELSSKHPNIKSWGIIGFCWGGKMTNLTSQKGTPFKAAVSAHPGMVDKADAPGVTIPILMLPSGGENKDDVEAWEKGLTVPHKVEWYEDQIHGFMVARGDLEDPKVVTAYEKAYKQTLEWFHEYLDHNAAKL